MSPGSSDHLPVIWVLGEMGVDESQSAAGGVQPGQHEGKADGEDVILRDRFPVDPCVDQP
jgi:hypothetical protein